MSLLLKEKRKGSLEVLSEGMLAHTHIRAHVHTHVRASESMTQEIHPVESLVTVLMRAQLLGIIRTKVVCFLC